eukprot:4000010-Prymnesium_polylepis.1
MALVCLTSGHTLQSEIDMSSDGNGLPCAGGGGREHGTRRRAPAGTVAIRRGRSEARIPPVSTGRPCGGGAKRMAHACGTATGARAGRRRCA